MKSHNGIASLVGNKLTLEDRIEGHLAQVATDAQLKDLYVDASDRQRVRRRAFIQAALDAIFEHNSYKVDTAGKTVEVASAPDHWSNLADARRDFHHDVALLDVGSKAQLILKPTRTDMTKTEVPVRAKVKELILWLAVIHLHQENLNQTFPTQQLVITKAAKATGRSANSILTELSYYTTQQRASDTQINYFWDLIKSVQMIARAGGDEKMAFSLLLPGALAISDVSIRN
tara:strand:+ start:190 stop:882 length:693 start_codon:yes stop_codon:yes gene_type:complete